MMRRFYTTILGLGLATPVFAGGFTYVKSIDTSPTINDLGAQLKDIAVDASGNLHMTTFFGTDGNNYVFKVTDPMGAATVTKLTNDAYPTDNGAGICFDKNGKFYVSVQSTGVILRYNADGTADTTWGTGGSLTVPAPRQISYTGDASHKLLVTQFGTPYVVYTVDCATGEISAATATTYGDPGDNGGQVNELFSGHVYDPATLTIYGNAQCDLSRITGADINDLNTFTDAAILTRHACVNVSNQGIAFDSASGLIAYTAILNSRAAPPYNAQVCVYNVATGYEIPVGAQVPGYPDYIDNFAGAAFLRAGGNLYLAAESSRDQKIQIFRYDAPFPARKWSWLKKIDALPGIPGGGRIKDVAADSAGNLYFTSFYMPCYIQKVSNPLDASPVITQFSVDELASSSGNVLSVDGQGNVYFCYQGADGASSYITKYDSSGALAPGFGTGGKLSPVICGGAAVRPRSIALTGTGKLFVCVFGTPYSMGIIDAATGADGGPIVSTFGDNTDVGIVNQGQVFQSAAYDAVNNAIYGNAQLDLVKMTGANATLNDLTSYNVVAGASLHRFPMTAAGPGGSDNLQLRIDPTGQWLAYSGFVDMRTGGDNYNRQMFVIVRNIATGNEEWVGNYIGRDGYINFGACPCFFKVGSTQYLAATNHYGASIEIFQYDPAAGVGEWGLY
ncbi:MAG: hypothetical protein WCK47_06790 [bacterium]